MMVMRRIVLVGVGLSLTACGVFQAAAPTPLPTPLPTDPLPPSEAPPPTFTPFPSVTPTTTQSPTPPWTPTVTSPPTALPYGLTRVPDLIGLHYTEASQQLSAASLFIIYRDVLDVDQPNGTIIAQEPAPGEILNYGDEVIVFRSFTGVGMLAGERCMPLYITTTSGTLLFWVELEQDTEYEIKTDFPYGETGLYDYRMIELESFVNGRADYMFYTPTAPGKYVIALGPFTVTQQQLSQNGGRIPVGGLCVFPPELHEDVE
jgi:hypothetical protein